MKKIFALLAFFATISTSCNKKENEAEPQIEKVPVASFTFSKSEYIEGETITATSNSSDAATQRWTLPDGQTSTGTSATYVIPQVGVERPLQFRLDVYSASKEKSDFSVKNVTAKVAMGQLTFYNNYFQTSQSFYVLPIPGTPQVIHMNPTTGTPTCGDATHPSIKLAVGTYTLKVYYGTTPSGSPMVDQKIGLSKDECKLIRVL